MDTEKKANQKGRKVPIPHDVFAKEMLSYKRNAVDFFRGILPRKLQDNLDLQTIGADKTTYPDELIIQTFGHNPAVKLWLFI